MCTVSWFHPSTIHYFAHSLQIWTLSAHVIHLTNGDNMNGLDASVSTCRAYLCPPYTCYLTNHEWKREIENRKRNVRYEIREVRWRWKGIENRRKGKTRIKNIWRNRKIEGKRRTMVEGGLIEVKMSGGVLKMVTMKLRRWQVEMKD